MEAKNIDDVLVKSMSEQFGTQPTIVDQKSVERPAESATNDSAIDPAHSPLNAIDEPTKQNESPANDPYQQPDAASNEQKEDIKKESEKHIDEYGNPIDKKQRLYTEEEVNQRIRERLSRGKYAEEQQQYIQPQTQPQQQNEEGDEDWRTQLRQEIRSEITQAQKEEQERQWRQYREQEHAKFEEKFRSGMDKYPDFVQTVQGKPINDNMMRATEGLENPAAFIYAAAKLHTKELERISQIANPIAQAAEVGRLHERMVKERKSVSSAPRPLEAPKGDLPQKVMQNQPSIEDRINQYGRQKRK